MRRKKLLKFVSFFLFLILVEKVFLPDFKIYADETERKIPKFVYRASPSKPDDKFRYGFIRDRALSTDLGLHISGDSGDSTAFISTTANRDYARQFATSYAMGWWHVREFYVYEIIPQSNFIDLEATYTRTITNSTTSPELRASLENARYTFTRENEYSALYEIRPETIISATRFEFDSNTRQFVQHETIENNITRVDRNNPQIDASLHENNFPLGTFNSMQIQYNQTSSGFACYIPNTSSNIRKKRDGNEKNYICPYSGKNIYETVQSPEEIFNKNTFKIKIEIFNKKRYCVSPKSGNYVYLDYCEKAAEWIYTDLGQIITLVHDGQNEQYYCLTSPINANNYNYIKLEICDLNLKEQIWNISSQG
ncbi:hypothetical protein QEJ31_14535 [Pigmentibacter sp. JX0631]|uniref:hypothetical protein n=1 Tax=Pigmentibacter sp. JX0631 TaxID=2976982 RepID=UPI002469604F|nr:hypothetical protein [Pigmentibacter sp. JX0631]WGL59747.1 hypothetical protein QEJ31_14535 [Pigmentibacter sp. JX0631]